MDEKRLRGAAIDKVFLALLVLAGIYLVEILGVFVVFFLNIPDESLWSSIILELAGAVAAVVGVALLGGESLSRPSRADVAYTFRFGWWCLVVGVALFALEMDEYLASVPISSDWLARTLECALFCLGVGVLEEYAFRGVVFNALLALFGGSHRGVVSSILATSLLFGLAHVDASEIVDVLSAVQAFLKVFQTGMYSVMLCVIVLRTHKLVGVSLFHALDDFLILVPSVGLFDEPITTDYVNSGDDAIPTIVFYLVIIALYMPFLIKAIRELWRGQDVFRGAFIEHDVEQVAARVSAPGHGQALVPVPPLVSPEPPVLASITPEGRVMSMGEGVRPAQETPVGLRTSTHGDSQSIRLQEDMRRLAPHDLPPSTNENSQPSLIRPRQDGPYTAPSFQQRGGCPPAPRGL